MPVNIGKGKRITNYLVLVAIIAIAAVYYFSNSKGTFKLRNTDFAISNLEDISEIRISQGDKRLVLDNRNGEWKVNSKYKVKIWNMNNFFTALNRIDILKPVSKTEKLQISTLLEKDGLLVEILNNKRTIKKYYVSRPSMSKSQTYMRMYKSNNPFIVHIPLFQGLVSELFVIDEDYWRDNTVFNYKPQNIKEIIVEYPQHTDQSFGLINYQDGSFSVKQIQNNSFLEDFNAEKVANYFTYFQSVTFESVLSDIEESKIDSITSTLPYFIISVTDIDNTKNEIKVYRKPPVQNYDEFGNIAQFDYNRAYGVLNDNHEIILIQYYIFDSLLKEINYFR